MHKRLIGLIIATILILLGLVFLYTGTQRLVTVVIDGQRYPIQTHALTVSWAIRETGIPIRPEDHIYPSVNTLLGWTATIYIDRASLAEIIAADGKITRTFWTTDRHPGNILASTGIKLFPGDQVLWNGEILDPAISLPPAPKYAIQYDRGSSLSVQDNGVIQVFSSSSPTVGSALWQAGIRLSPADAVSQALENSLDEQTTIRIKRAVPIRISLGSQAIKLRSAGTSVGEVLAEAGMPIEGLDSSTPAENQPVSSNSQIKTTHVTENISLQQSLIPFKTEFVADPNTELDQQGVLQKGVNGIKVTRQRTRYENGKEVSRKKDAEWVASPPVSQKNGYGTKVVIHKLQIGSETIEYWRAVNVYATSYSPCGLGNVSKCYYGTSLGLPVKKGVIAVTPKWYRVMAGQAVYVPGYGKGIIADIGAGIPGRNWIDLGFTDEDLELWHQQVTLYFLTPVPANIPWILP